MKTKNKLVLVSIYKLAAVAVCMLAPLASVRAQNLIQDPSFELSSPVWSFAGSSGLTSSSYPHGSVSAYVNAPVHGTTGSVSQTISTVVGQSYTVDFWLAANGVAGGDVTVSFGNTTGFSQTYAWPTYFDWTEYTFTTVATASSSTFTFAGTNLDGTFFIDDVSVTGTNTPPPQPSASIYTAVELDWMAISNATYQVQWSPDVASTNWTNLGLSVAGTGTSITIFDSTRNSSKKFYRVLRLQ
jgi:hypothetical protein